MSATGAPAMSRTDTAVRVISASPDRVFAALTDPDALPGPALGIPKRDTGHRFRSDTQCERRLAARRAPDGSLALRPTSVGPKGTRRRRAEGGPPKRTSRG